MNSVDEVIGVICTVLQIRNGRSGMSAETALLGAIPEFDSMAVVSVITALEENFGFVIDDDEVDAETFTDIGSLAELVDRKLAE